MANNEAEPCCSADLEIYSAQKVADINKSCYCAIIHNIPQTLRSRDLRKFFAHAVENDMFKTFHYKHRAEIKASCKDDNLEQNKKTSNCCVVMFSNHAKRENFIKEYHLEHWSDTGTERCFIKRVSVNPELLKMPELNPPALLPMGNVGTPNQVICDLISACKLPKSVLRSLVVSSLPQIASKRRFYAQVPPPDQESVRKVYGDPGVDGQETFDPGESNASDGESSGAEDWERHEALENDVTKQNRTKPRLYEQEEEVIWEKGGPGLVFYTDDFVWDQMEGKEGSDEKWADDWEVDMRIYEEPEHTGDRTAEEMLEIRREKLLRSGDLKESVFSKRKSPVQDTVDKRNSAQESEVGSFEKHNRGIGKKVLQKQGWIPGQGLGKQLHGKPHSVALESEGQSPLDRKGLGYRGEKLQRYGLKRPQTMPSITTVYDDPDLLAQESQEHLHEARPEHYLKYRPK